MPRSIYLAVSATQLLLKWAVSIIIEVKNFELRKTPIVKSTLTT